MLEFDVETRIGNFPFSAQPVPSSQDTPQECEVNLWGQKLMAVGMLREKVAKYQTRVRTGVFFTASVIVLQCLVTGQGVVPVPTAELRGGGGAS